MLVFTLNYTHKSNVHVQYVTISFYWLNKKFALIPRIDLVLCLKNLLKWLL